MNINLNMSSMPQTLLIMFMVAGAVMITLVMDTNIVEGG